MPCFVMAIALSVLLPVSAIITSIANAIKPGCVGINLNIDEDLPPFFDALE